MRHRLDGVRFTLSLSTRRVNRTFPLSGAARGARAARAAAAAAAATPPGGRPTGSRPLAAFRRALVLVPPRAGENRLLARMKIRWISRSSGPLRSLRDLKKRSKAHAEAAAAELPGPGNPPSNLQAWPTVTVAVASTVTSTVTVTSA
jgi:hypothetical protein